MALAGRTPTPLRKGPKCRMCVLHMSLPPEDQAELTRWLDETIWTRAQILEMLTADGHDVGTIAENVFGNHRRKDCYGRRNGLV